LEDEEEDDNEEEEEGVTGGDSSAPVSVTDVKIAFVKSAPSNCALEKSARCIFASVNLHDVRSALTRVQFVIVVLWKLALGAERIMFEFSNLESAKDESFLSLVRRKDHIRKKREKV